MIFVNMFSPKGSYIWNSLPVHIVNASSVTSFKSNFDRFWSNQKVYCTITLDVILLKPETEV